MSSPGDDPLTSPWTVKFFEKFAQKFKDRPPRSTGKVEGLITYGENVVYVWDEAEGAVYAFNIKKLTQSECSSQLVLKLKKKILFDVSRIELNSSCTQLCLWGVGGAAVITLPVVWPKDTEFATSPVSLSERLFLGELQKLRLAKWHPGSPSDSHLVLLTSDERLRCYNTLNGTLTWNCLLSKHVAMSTSIIPNKMSLGDTPVGFDFAPPPFEENQSAIKWPILVLWGNGDVYIVTACLSHNKTTLIGPLLMFPSSDDNYGSDASSILVLNTSPPIVALSTCTGTIYHFLLMSSEDSEMDQALFVVESVELNLGITLSDEEDALSCPVHLMPYPLDSSRYFSIHKGGVHSVTIPLAAKLLEFAEGDDESMASYKDHSFVEYLLCTALNSNSSNETAPLIGCTFHELSMSLLILLSSGTLFSVRLLPRKTDSALPTTPDQSLSLDDDGFRLKIENLIKEGGVKTQPLIKLPPGTKPRDGLELLLRMTHHFRSVVKTHEDIQALIESKASSVSEALCQQETEVAELNEKRADLCKNAEQIAEKYEEMNEKLMSLTPRLERVLQKTYLLGPGLSLKEKTALDSLRAVQAKLDVHKEDIHRVNSLFEYQNQFSKEKTDRDFDLNNRSSYLDGAKCRKVKREVSELTSDIAATLKRVRDLKMMLTEHGLIQ